MLRLNYIEWRRLIWDFIFLQSRFWATTMPTEQTHFAKGKLELMAITITVGMNHLVIKEQILHFLLLFQSNQKVLFLLPRY